MLIMEDVMKTIGVILRKIKAYNSFKYSVPISLLKYINLSEINIIGIIIDDDSNINYIKSNIDICDGIILPGGNVNDDKVLEIIRYLYFINKPTLGICLGMQQMVLALGGNIIKLDNNNHMSKMKYVHEVFINKTSMLYSVLKKEKILVNSRHNYAILNTNLDVCAISSDNIIESVESKSKTFFLGVQWHPEDIGLDVNSKLIMKNFIKACSN